MISCVGDDDCVYVRTIRGLERVDVIYRRINDTFLDPECFDKDSVLGVPGSCARGAPRTSRSPTRPGAGVADDKVVYAYVPEIIQVLLAGRRDPAERSDDLLRDEKSRKHVIANLANLVVKPANESGGYGMLIGPRSTAEERAAMAAAIEANPRNYIAQPVLALSTAPTLVHGEIEPRHLDLRPFILQGERVWVTPGGLTRVALRRGSLVVNSSQGGGSKDTWIVRGRPVMSLLSRVAERIYWSARYLERAETTSRLARVYGNLLLDLPRQAGLKWDLLIQITGCAELYQRAASGARASTLRSASSSPTATIRAPIRSSLAQARESIRTTRDIVPSEAWRSVNELCMYVSRGARRRHLAAPPLRDSLARGRGLPADQRAARGHDEPRLGLSVLSHRPRARARRHDDANHRRGRRDAVGRDDLARFDNTLWMAVLQSLSAYQMYRQKVRRRISSTT